MAAGALVSVDYPRNFALDKAECGYSMRGPYADGDVSRLASQNTQSCSQWTVSKLVVFQCCVFTGGIDGVALSDANASLRDVACSGVHGHRERFHADIVHGRHARAVEGRIVGYHGCRACTRSAFWHVRGSKGVRGRQRRRCQKSVDRDLYVVFCSCETV